jgi:hypothetical protein
MVRAAAGDYDFEEIKMKAIFAKGPDLIKFSLIMRSKTPLLI